MSTLSGHAEKVERNDSELQAVQKSDSILIHFALIKAYLSFTLT